MICFVQNGNREVEIMSKAVIIYGSKHHENTYRLVQAISERYDVVLINAETQKQADLSQYDLIGFASGIDFGRFYSSVEGFLKDNLPVNKRVFFIYTCAKKSNRFTACVKAMAHEKEAVLMGEYGCRGYNTYGPWKVIGGMNKNHPTKDEIEEAVQFYGALVQNMIE